LNYFLKENSVSPFSNLINTSSTSPSDPVMPLVHQHKLVNVEVEQGMSSFPKAPYTVLIPNFSEGHAQAYAEGINSNGYNFVVIPDMDAKQCIELGLKYVDNDTCYGAIILVGLVIQAIIEKHVDVNKCHIGWIHMGGSCSARTMAHQIRRGLILAGYESIKVSEFNNNYLVNPGLFFDLTFKNFFIFGV
jgi:predicted nucleotide-binding protein (sugar kinase/HSP70/actin superfamily)